MRRLFDYLREMLKVVGRCKVYYRTEMGWVDIFCRNVTFDISKYPNRRRYERLGRCVVVTDFEDSFGKTIFTTEEKVHKVLSCIFSRDFVSYQDWLESYEDRDLNFYERVFNLMKDRYGRTIAKKLIEALVFLYTAGQALEGERVPYSKLFPYLLNMGLIVEETKDVVKPKNFTASPTLDGVRVAKVEIFERIDEDRIYRIARDFGFEKLFIAILGLSERRGMFLKDVNVDSSSDFYDLIGKIDLNMIFKFSRNRSPVEGLCLTLCYTVFYKDVVGFFRDLMDQGLSYYYPVHDAYGSFLGRVYGIPREVASLLSSMSFCEIERDFVERFKELTDMFYKRCGSGSEFEKAFELGVIERCEGGIRLGERFENFARVRFAKLLSEFCEGLNVG